MEGLMEFVKQPWVLWFLLGWFFLSLVTFAVYLCREWRKSHVDIGRAQVDDHAVAPDFVRRSDH